jgi:hypothetical protein
MSSREPYEELDEETTARVVRVFSSWAEAQEEKGTPFLELADGTSLTPADLLAERPPGESPPGPPPLYARLPGVGRPQRPRAWTHLLNLVAVSATYGEDDLDQLLHEIALGADAEGPAEAGSP